MVATRNRIIVDSGPLVGFLDSSDQWHSWAKDAMRSLPSPFLTCESVLSESSYLLGGEDALLELVETGALEILTLFPIHGARIRSLMHSDALTTEPNFSSNANP